MSVHGTAEFAARGELRRARLVGNWTPGEPPHGMLLGWWYESPYDFEPVAYNGDLNQLIVGGIGGGKFTTALAPLLLGSRLDESSVVVIDPKGEIAQLVGPFFQKPFAEKASVFAIDPWDVCGVGGTACVNVLDPIRADNPNCVDDARALADAMIIPSGSENTHWDNAARNFLTGVILYVALHEDEEGKRDLTRVRDIVTMRWELAKAYAGPPRPTLSELLSKHANSDLAGGAIRRAFTGLFNREDKERSGIISSIERDTAWIDSVPMVAALKGPGLDLKEAALGTNKYFVVLPAEYFMTHRAWLRLMITAFANAMKRYKPDKAKPQHARWRHIVIDEFANLGEMSFMLNEIAIARGFDVKYHLAVQDFAQLQRLYKDGWQSFVNGSFQRYFALSDLFTLDYISRTLGPATVQSVSRSWSETRNHSYSSGLSHSTSTGYSTPPGLFRFSTSTGGSSDTTTTGYSESVGESIGRSESQVQRPLLTTDEVRRLGQDDQILVMRDLHPIRCWRPPYWDAFPSLPGFTLKEVLGTVGREPESLDELDRYTAWRRHPLLIMPQPLPEPQPVLPLPPPSPPPPPDWRLIVGFGALVLALLVTWIASS